MKVLVISHMYPSSFNSMAGIFVHKQVRAMAEQGVEFKVVSPVPYSPAFLGKIKKRWRDYAGIPLITTMDGVEVYYPRYIEFPRSIFFGWSGYFMKLGIGELVKDIYRDFKFDIIHSHVALPDGFAAMLLNKDFNVPHIITIHGQDLQVTVNKGKTARSNLMRALNSADGIITISNKLRNLLDGDLGQKARVIYNGIDLKDIGQSGGESQGDTVILSVSNLHKTKGIDLNIRAVASLLKKYPNIRYRIIGDGPEGDDLMRLSKDLGIASRVEFLGRLPHNEVIEHMKACSIFCLPSYREGFGIVYLEAMACGKPIIGVMGEGISEIVEDGKNGFLVKPESVQDIADRIEYIICNPDKARHIGAGAADQVRKEFTWEAGSEEIIEFYDDVLKLV